MITKTESYLYSPPLAVSHWPPAEGLEKKQIAADSVQNPNDPDAEYRQKGQQKVKGYSVNITETTDQREDAPGLITGVQVEGATAADNAFYGEAIAKSEAATGEKVETAYSDGADQNAGNRAMEGKRSLLRLAL